jgi:hypothetical protein
MLVISLARERAVGLSPSCRVSQVPPTDISLRAVPNHPGRSGGCVLIASPPVSGFIIFGRLATFTLRHEAESVRPVRPQNPARLIEHRSLCQDWR